jgi:hypothetical protein
MTGPEPERHFDFVTPEGVTRVTIGSATSPCRSCGTSNEDCLHGVLDGRGFCCDDCMPLNTHRPAEPEV